LQNLKNMTTDSNAIASVNGDFFAAGSGGRGNSVGFSMIDDKLISSTYYENYTKDTFATFLLPKNGAPLFNYMKENILLKCPETNDSIKIGDVNKYSTNFAIPTLYTTPWGKCSHGAQEDLPLTEMVVANGIVTEIRYNQPGAEIPENGYVISTINAGADFINKNFKVGSKVELELSIIPDLENISFAISGGAILVKDGAIPTFSSNIVGLHPRTAIASSKDGQTIYLVTVDGRQSSSIGMSQTDLANFLIEIGAYNAINLDGGGSTTMISRKLGDSFLSVINSPSDKSLRPVINGVGVFNTSPKGALQKLIIEVIDTNVFIGKSRNVLVKGYDQYYNPIEINQNEVTWSFNGVPVSVKNGLLTGDTVGMTMLKATVGKTSGSIEINILSDPNELEISPKKISLSSGEKVTFTISAKNKNGYYSTLNANEVTWNIEQGGGSIKDNVYTAGGSGDAIISVSSGNAKSYALVSIKGKIATLVDNFEDENYIFDPYPDAVGGSASKSSAKVHSGKFSAKLSYDFNTPDRIRAAYIEFKNKGLDVPEGVTDISFWVYNEGEKQDDLKIKMKDANGNYHLIILQSNITHSGWKEIYYSLESIPLPAKLTDIYLAQDKIEIKSSGYIYVDDLYFHKSSDVTNSTTKLPNDIKGKDSQNISSNLQNTDSFRISLYDNIKQEELLLDKMKYSILKDVINTNSEFAVFTSQGDNNLLADIKVPYIIPTLYSITMHKNSLFITINSGNGGIRKSDSSAWIKLQKDIKETKSDNIFIVLSNSLDDFTDSLESKLFIDTLCDLKRETGKNIWVIHKGAYTDFSMERGVKYLGINNSDIKSDDIMDVAKNTKYIMITVNGKNLTYEIKNLF
jgi:exopolysaccharide biosynthesis protein